MTRIITAPDGTRYRFAKDTPPGAVAELPNPPGCRCPPLRYQNANPTGHMGPQIPQTTVEPLPRIPDWPLPGPVPQYLGKVNPLDKTRQGDVYLLPLDTDGDGIIDEVIISKQTTPDDKKWGAITMQRFWSVYFQLSITDDATYLICRANPEEDA